MKNSTLIFSLLLFAACANESDPAADKANFVRIYDNDRYNAAYFPIDIKQTPDKGYLILGGREVPEDKIDTDNNTSFTGTYLLKVDEEGDVVSEQEVPTDVAGPVGPLLESADSYYFFNMDAKLVQAQLSQLDADGNILKTTSAGGRYPQAAYNDNGNFLLLRYDDFGKKSVVAVINPATGLTSLSKDFTVGSGDGVDEPILNHFLRTGKQFPYQVGKTLSGQYFFNGFYNYTFSLVFTNLASSTPLGVVQGNQDDAGFSALMPLDGDRYAAARFSFGDNYLLPNTTIGATGTTSSVDLGGYNFPELTSNATVKIISTLLHGKETILYGSTTQSNQIALYGYEKATGKFLGSKYLGFSNPYEMGAFTVTSDGGLAVAGTTYVAGRFSRVCIFKISKDELEKSFK